MIMISSNFADCTNKDFFLPEFISRFSLIFFAFVLDVMDIYYWLCRLTCNPAPAESQHQEINLLKIFEITQSLTGNYFHISFYSIFS